MLDETADQDLHWVSLQLGAPQAELAAAHLPHVTDVSHRLKDFADTAAVIGHLDLVLAVDTGVAHLAGALGKPVWTLLSDTPNFRWQGDEHTSRWYPTMRLFRRPREGTWDGVMETVARALRIPTMAATDSEPSRPGHPNDAGPFGTTIRLTR
ncbi:MAG TPA: glycosyltransferase family 9 protein [Nevskiaceae bacterium]|nr:glycosyltransferase family 9 protein [Nevskiaceae bacterium]